MLLPDTNVWIQLIKDKNPKLKSRWGSVSLADIAVCAIVKAELWHGAHKYLQPESRRRIVDSWLAPYHSFPFDDSAAHHYAELRHYLEARGEVIGPNDLKMAAICLAHDLTLVTGNVGEFRRVPGLQVEDWSQG
jgi:tRNA(fMet)-specific endonuclease VapC